MAAQDRSREGNAVDERQQQRYRDEGYAILPELLNSRTVDELCAELKDDCKIAGPHNIPEPNYGPGGTVYALHHRSELFELLIRSPHFLGPARKLLDTDVYLYQMKVNIKA